MKSETVAALSQLNQQFYDRFAVTFAHSRENPQPGFAHLLPYLPDPCQTVLDAGCGNGRFGHFLAAYVQPLTYIGVDFSAGLLDEAASRVPGTYWRRDLSQPLDLSIADPVDLAVCLAAMQHIAGRKHRLQLLQGLRETLGSHGRVFLSNWQFMDSARQRRKVVPWAEASIDPADLEEGDYLLTWQRDGRGLRYVHQVDEIETAWLADQAGMRIVAQFRGDGREGNLNLYTVLAEGTS